VERVEHRLVPRTAGARAARIASATAAFRRVEAVAGRGDPVVAPSAGHREAAAVQRGPAVRAVPPAWAAAVAPAAVVVAGVAVAAGGGDRP